MRTVTIIPRAPATILYKYVSNREDSISMTSVHCYLFIQFNRFMPNVNFISHSNSLPNRTILAAVVAKHHEVELQNPLREKQIEYKISNKYADMQRARTLLEWKNELHMFDSFFSAILFENWCDTQNIHQLTIGCVVLPLRLQLCG